MSHDDFNKIIYKTLTYQVEPPYCVELIQDLVNGAGYSYSRIARCVGASPSTIQKLMTNHKRKPRYATFYSLLMLHYEVFHGPGTQPHEKAYMQLKEARLQRINKRPIKK